MKQKLSLVEI